MIFVIAVWLLSLLWGYKAIPNMAAFWAVSVLVASLIGSLYVWAWRKSAVPGSVGGESLDRVADRLAAAVQAQWQRAAGEGGLTGADPIRVGWRNPSATTAGAVTAAGSTRFSPLPGLAWIQEGELASGQAGDLHALYGGLGSGRLIITGPPGSGKTGAAILLVLAALRHRENVSGEDRQRVPVPVLLTAQDWNPDTEPVADWLVRKLRGAYVLLGGTAGARAARDLLDAGRIAVILDGLDEISPELRSVALRALSRQAAFRLVVLSRTSEMTDAAGSRGFLHGAAAVELNPVSADEAADYLERTQLDPPPAGWRELAERVRADPGSPLSRALENPLALTVVRDTYVSGDSVRELLDFCDTLGSEPVGEAAGAITGYLLDRLLPAAYTRHPGQEPLPYDLETAQRTLTLIAARMDSDGTRDLNWWQVPAWLSRTPDGSPPHVIGDVRLGKALTRRNLVAGLAAGLASGLGAGLAFGFAAGRLRGIAAGLVLGFAVTFLLGIRNSLRAAPESIRSLDPAASWRGNRRYGLTLGLTAGLVTGLAMGLSAGLAFGFAAGLAAGFAAGAASGIAAGLLDTRAFPVSLAAIRLALRWRSPWRLMHFLEDAHRRNVLRAVGPAYQFRHAILQDRLAALSTPGGTSLDWAGQPAGRRLDPGGQADPEPGWRPDGPTAQVRVRNAFEG